MAVHSCLLPASHYGKCIPAGTRCAVCDDVLSAYAWCPTCLAHNPSVPGSQEGET